MLLFQHMFKKFNWVLLGILILAFVLRTYRLGEIPAGVTNDEVTYIYNAYSVAKTGSDINGQFLPWITKVMVPFQPVPIYFIAPFVSILGLNVFTGRLPIALAGVGVVLLIYLIVNKIFRFKLLALLSALALSLSPWHLQLSRSAYDPPIALLFYMMAIYFALLKKTILLFICLFLAIYSYRAMNILFLPIFVLIIWFKFSEFNHNKKYILMYLIGITILMYSYFIIAKNQGSYYFNEATHFESPLNFNLAGEVVNNEITNTDAPIFISRIFINKLTYSMRLLRENYLGAFSTDFLFTKGEANPIYNIWWRGVLYLIDLPLIICGLIFIFNKNKKSALFVVASLLIGALPASLSGPTGTSYVARAFFMTPFWSVLIAGGVVYLIKKYHILIIPLLIIYSFQVCSYLFQYHFRYSIYGAEAWFKSTADVSKFIINNSPANKVYFANASIFELINYSFYNKENPRIVQAVVKNGQKKGVYGINNIVFSPDCLGYGEDDPQTFIKPKTIYISRPNCHREYQPDKLIRRYNGKFLDTSEIIWKIYYPKENI